VLVFGHAAAMAGVRMLRVGVDIGDAQRLLTKRYDGQPGTTYLIRPDQHVAARWRRFDAVAVRAAMARCRCEV
ncbi:MAG: hypothetical protein WCC57_16575, partial [Paracoccaceae bacterium]